jgi:hypothetical protein
MSPRSTSIRADIGLDMADIVAPALACRSCGGDMHYLGKLPAIRLHTAAHIFKCQPCMTVRIIDLGAAVLKEIVARPAKTSPLSDVDRKRYVRLPSE